MIYTIGHRESYEQGFREQPTGKFAKLGAGTLADGEDYAGGIVFKTREEAQEYIDSRKSLCYTYDVYGVEADWDEDTDNVIGEYGRRLLKTSRLVWLLKAV